MRERLGWGWERTMGGELGWLGWWSQVLQTSNQRRHMEDSQRAGIHAGWTTQIHTPGHLQSLSLRAAMSLPPWNKVDSNVARGVRGDWARGHPESSEQGLGLKQLATPVREAVRNALPLALTDKIKILTKPETSPWLRRLCKAWCLQKAGCSH